MKKKAPEEQNVRLFKQIAPSALRKGDLRKLEIIEATVKCLAEHGWMGTNYATVGKAAGMERPHVAYHFPDWDELMATVIQFVYATGQSVVSDYLRDIEEPRELLKAYISGTFHWLYSNPNHGPILMLTLHLSAISGARRKQSSQLKLVGVQRVEAMLSSLFKDKKKLRRRANAIHAMIVGRCVECITTDYGRAKDAFIRETFESAWEIASN